MKFKLFLLSCILLTLSNCSRYYDWAQSTFVAGCKRDICLPVCDFACSSAIYDQFRTVGLFDILWLNARARAEFVKLRTNRQQLSERDRCELIYSQKRDLAEKIEFYVLMPALDIESLPTEPGSPAPWSVSLQVGDCTYQPYSIKPVDLEPEFAYMFDCFYLSTSFIRFRRVYRVLFKACNDEHEQIMRPGVPCVKMTISSIEYCNSCSWPVPDSCELVC